MPRKPTPPPLTLSARDAAPAAMPAQLPLGTARGVRVMLEGSDLAAVEAAAAELKLRFGMRFAVTGRRLTAGREALRISAGLIANLDTVLDAEGIRQWALPETWRTRLLQERRTATADGKARAASAPLPPDPPAGDEPGKDQDAPGHHR